MPVAAAASQAGLGHRAGKRLPEVREHPFHTLGLGLDAQESDAQVAQFRDLRRQVDDVFALDLDAVDAEQLLAIASGPRQAVGVIAATEATLVLGQVDRACGAPARPPNPPPP